MPPLPPVPQLAEQMREGHGLYTPFAKFDQQHQEWARQLGLNLQTAHSSILRVAEHKTKASTQQWPDRGWCRLIRQPDGWWVDGSILYRPNSAKIWIEVLANRVSGYESSVTQTVFNGQVTNGKWITEKRPIWVETGAVPRAFRITIVSEGTDTDRVGAVPVITMVPGTAVTRNGTEIMGAVTDGVVQVVSRLNANTFTCWLHSVMDNPAPDTEIHCDACHVTLV